MQRFCDVARTCLQRIKPTRGRKYKLVDIDEIMGALIQIYQKVVALYEEIKRNSTELDMSENIDEGLDELEDSLSIICRNSKHFQT